MDDPELDMIRQQRMMELQGKKGGGGGGGMGMGASGEQQQQEAQKRQQMEEMRQSMLAQVLTSEARERISRIALVKPEKARAVEDSIIRAAQSGQLASKIDENKLIQMLEQSSEKQGKPKITIQRKKRDSDDDD